MIMFLLKKTVHRVVVILPEYYGIKAIVKDGKKGTIYSLDGKSMSKYRQTSSGLMERQIITNTQITFYYRVTKGKTAKIIWEYNGKPGTITAPPNVYQSYLIKDE